MTRRKTKSEFIALSRKLHGKDRYNYTRVEYINNRTKVELYCNKCKKWFFTRPTDHTTKVCGCPNCKRFKSERMAISILEEILMCTFYAGTPKIVPWLDGLYFDGYNEEKKIAIEYQGIQHTIFPNFFHKNRSEFEKQQENDIKKIKKCIEKEVKLILVPYKYTYKNREKMENFIRKKILKI